MEKDLNQFEISEATPEDARGIKEVSYYSWLATYPNEEAGVTLEDIQDRLKDALSEEKIAQKAEQIANASEDDKSFVVKEGGKVVGHCHVKRYPNKNQLHAIYVLPEYAGKGIGTKLWGEVQRFFDPTKETTVEVATYNQNAIDFYKKIGFQDTKHVFNDERLRMKSGAIIPQMEMKMIAKENKI